MAYSNSKLATIRHISPFKNVGRTHAIDRVSVHCVVGQCTAETLGNIFSMKNKNASSNYGVGKDGSIGLYVEEKDRSWCTSSSENDNRAVTIEVASDTYEPYKVTDAAYKALIKLLVDICKRNGKTKLIWFGDKSKTLNYSPKSNEMVMTVHRWFANKSCPGAYLYNLHSQIAAEVTKQLSGSTGTSASQSSAASSSGSTGSASAFKPYIIRVTVDALNIRKGPGTNYGIAGCIRGKGAYTITAESSGTGAKKWGKLKSGAGWISLDYTKKA